MSALASRLEPSAWMSAGTAGRRDAIDLRRARPTDVAAIYALIDAHVHTGHVLPRSREDIAIHIHRFVVAIDGGAVKGCVELAPLGETVAEVRSLVVAPGARGLGAGRALTLAVIDAARAASFERICAFTHAPAFFVRLGFSLVPHLHLPEKIAVDCLECPLFLRCGQRAVALDLSQAARAQAVLERAS